MTETEINDRHNRQIRFCLYAIFLLLLVFIMDFASGFLLPVIVAFFIAMAFRPAIRRLSKYGVPAWVTASSFMFFTTSAGLLFVYTASGPIQNWIASAPEYSRVLIEKAKPVQNVLRKLTDIIQRVETATADPLQPVLQEVVVKQSAGFAFAGQLTDYSMSFIGAVVLMVVIATFLMASGDLFYTKLVHVLPTLRDKKTALRIVYDVENEVSAYLLTVTAINFGLGAAIGLSFYALGMPMALIFGLMAFSLNFIPYLGAIVGVTVTTIIAIVTFDSLSYAALMPLTYIFWNSVENQLATPLLLGRRLRLNAVAILLALTFWTWLWGIAGTIVAVPILVTIKVFCDHLPSLAGVGEFLSERSTEDRDEHSAAEVATSLRSSAPGQ